MSEMYFNRGSGETPVDGAGDSNDSAGLDREAGFPLDPECVISAEDALAAITKAITQVKDYREGRLFLFKTIVGPLVTADIREKLDKWNLTDYSIPYGTIMSILGGLTAGIVLLGLDKKYESVRANQRLLILPFLDFALRARVKMLEETKPFGWRIARRYYKRNIETLTPLVDNLVNLASMAWTFCPGIGEPEKDTGFYNRFVLTSNAGFVDLGHFFNCTALSFVDDNKATMERAERCESRQRWLREFKLLQALRKVESFDSITTFIWGYATSADTIEDRSSNYHGILLGEYMRNLGDNKKAIEYFVKLYPKIILDIVKLIGGQRSLAGKIMESVKLFFKMMRPVRYKCELADIPKQMKSFFEEYDAIDPKDGDVVPRGLIPSITKFYDDKMNSEEWDKFSSKRWEVVLPQDIWERVVRGRPKFGKKKLPIKIQLKDSGKIVDPYEGDAPG